MSALQAFVILPMPLKDNDCENDKLEISLRKSRQSNDMKCIWLQGKSQLDCFYIATQFRYELFPFLFIGFFNV